MIVKETRNGQQFYRPVVILPNVIELAYYSNSLVPHFALDSIMVTALNTLAKDHDRLRPSSVIFIFFFHCFLHPLHKFVYFHRNSPPTRNNYFNYVSITVIYSVTNSF